MQIRKSFSHSQISLIWRSARRTKSEPPKRFKDSARLGIPTSRHSKPISSRKDVIFSSRHESQEQDSSMYWTHTFIFATSTIRKHPRRNAATSVDFWAR